MWVLPSRSRPQNLERMIETGMTMPVYLRLDDDDSMLQGYRDIDFPLGWVFVVAKRTLLSSI